ncbi:MAG TPA: ABC transporter permease [Candidatus Limnocylindrales bacterium]
MDVLTSTLAWLLDPGHWSGTDGIPTRIVEHLAISIVSLAAAGVIALPVGALIGHTGRGGTLAVNLANLGRAVPSYAILVIVLPPALQLASTFGYDPSFGLSEIPTFTAMFLLAIPPILINTYGGLREVDRDLVEAARGMGLRERQILFRLEVPLALPVIVGGIRTAAVQVVATATLGAVVAYGGLGRYIIDGIARRENDRLFAGVVLVAILALTAEGLLALAQRRLTPRGVAGAGERGFQNLAEVPVPPAFLP